MTDAATEYWLQVHHLIPWLAATQHNRAIIEGYRRRGFTPEETAPIITRWREDYRQWLQKSAGQ